MALRRGLAGVSIVVGLAGAIAIAGGYASRVPTGQTPQTRQVKIPAFPISEQTLDLLDPDADRYQVRWHAWNLLLQLTRGVSVPNLPPAWERRGFVPGGPWQTKCELNLNRTCADLNKSNMRGAGVESPPFSPQVAPLPPADVGQRRFSTVFYSGAAADWIRTNGLAYADRLDERLVSSNDVPEADKSSILVKEIWEGVSLGPGFDLSLAVFDPKSTRIDSGKQLPPLDQWPMLSLKKGTGNVLDESTSCGSQDYTPKAGQAGFPEVPVKCFYYQKSPSRCDALVSLSSGAQIQNSGVVGGLPQCVVVLVGLQIATREQSKWTWTTFWWTGRSKSECLDLHGYCTDGRPDDLPEPFSRFAMETMLTSPSQLKQRAVFNPYLEGPQPNGAVSTCFQCHNNARYERDGSAATQRNGRQVTNQFIVTPDRRCDLSAPNRVADGCPLYTSMLWSLATNQDNVSVFANSFIRVPSVPRSLPPPHR